MKTWTLNEVKEYLSELTNHHISKDSKTQTLDLIEYIGDGEVFRCSKFKIEVSFEIW